MAAGLAVLALSPACRPADDVAAAPLPLQVVVEQSNDAENRGLLELVVRNEGDRAVRVTSVQLQSPELEAMAPRAFDDLVRPATQTAFSVGYGRPRCDVDPAPSAVALRVAVEPAAPDQPPGEQLLVVPATDPVLRSLVDSTCSLERLQQQVSVGFGPTWERAGDTVVGSLILERRGGQARVQVVELAGSQVFSVVPEGALPLVAPSATGSATLPLRFAFPVCVPHVVIESKRSYVFNVYVAVDGDEPLLVQPTPDVEGITALERLLRDGCAAAGY